MLPNLSIPELARAYWQAEEPQLKRAVLDEFEKVATTEALSYLNEALDDPDPELQLYALNAVDRLLSRR
jgi:hypothetical protein